MKRTSFIAAMLLAALPLAAQAPKAKAPAAPEQAARILPFQATETTLKNGLRVIVVPTGFPNIVSLQIPVQTGSRNEVEPGKSGFAHFFEHMMFRGTEKYPTDAYNDVIVKAGARQNAYTTDDFTNYHITFAKEDLEKILEIEADRFQNLLYSEEDFKTEARAVLGEYNKNSANPVSKLIEVARDNAFTTHTYKHTTMGFIRDIEDMPNQFDYSKVFFDRWYRPEKTAIIVAGDVTAQEVIPLVEKYWGNWKRGSFTAEIPQEPPSQAPVYAHVPWSSPTLPWVMVGFRGPAFSETEKDYAAISTMFSLYFGSTSDLFKRLVQQEQKVDQMFAWAPETVDPSLAAVYARVKNPDDALYVRNEILKTLALARSEQIDAQRLEDSKSSSRYGFVRALDNTESIASNLARYVRYRRSFDTLNNAFALYQNLTPADLQNAAKKYVTDNNIVVTTLSQNPLVDEISTIPSLASFAAASPSTAAIDITTLRSPLPQLNIKMQFDAGSARDPKGKEGLAALTAMMIADAGSKEMRYDEITKALFPIAGSFGALVDKEVVTFTAGTHKDNWQRHFQVALPQLLDPGFRQEDFDRIKARQLNSLTQDLRGNNEEELGKERLQSLIFAGTPYAHPVLGTVAGIEAITLDDVRDFARRHYTLANLRVAAGGDLPEESLTALRRELAKLPAGEKLPPTQVVGKRPNGMNVEIIQKDTRATAISFGLPIAVTRSHPDFAALNVARAWLGEHRSSMSHLFNRIREVRGLNYGTYAYIEAFPRGMFQFFPDANIPRRAQIFEVWIRPVVPENAHMSLRIATHELEQLIENGLTEEQFETARGYLMKNVYVMTSTQNQQVGYALDSPWYGIPEYTKFMRDALSRLTAEEVNAAVKKHLSAKDLQVVMITDDAEGLRSQLIGDGFSPVVYDAAKPAELLEEDKVIGARKLSLTPERVKITPVTDVFAK
jgi:zinc protease